MPEPTNTPAAAAPSPTPASPSAPTPAASPASPSSAPAAAAGSGSPATPTAHEEGKSVLQVLQEKIAKGYSPDGTGGEINQGPEGEPAPSADDLPNPDAAPAAEEDAEAAAAAATEAETPAVDPEIAAIFEDDSEFGPQAITAAIGDDQALTAALESNPAAKAAIFANARKAERAQKYDEILGSPEEAAIVAEGHNAFVGVQNLMTSVDIDKPETLDAVINAMRAQTVLRDEEGNPLKNPDGSLKTNGVVGKFFKGFFKQRLAYMAAVAAKGNNGVPDEEALAAIDILMERSGMRAPSSPNNEDLSEEQRARIQDVERREADLKKSAAQARQEQERVSIDRVNAASDAMLDSLLKRTCDAATGLDDFSRRNVERDIRKGLRAAIANKQTYRSQRDAIEARAPGPKREQALIKLNTEYINTYLPGVARKVLAEAGASVVGKAKQREATSAARADAARSESRSSLPAVRPAAPNTGESIDQIKADLTKTLGRAPSIEQILTERMKRSKAFA